MRVVHGRFGVAVELENGFLCAMPDEETALRFVAPQSQKLKGLYDGSREV